MDKKNNDFINELFNSIFGTTDEASKINDAKAKDSSNELNKAAIELKKFYDSLVNAGFTDEQAFKFIGMMLSMTISNR